MKLSLTAAVAQSTGESRSTIRHRGFSRCRILSSVRRPNTSLAVGLICPGCGDELPLLQQPGDELPELAECDRCDACYPYDDEELQVLEAVAWPLSRPAVQEAVAVPA